MQVHARFMHVVTIDDIGHEVEIECSSSVDEYDNIVDVVIESIYSYDMDRDVSASELTNKQVDKIFDKALKKLNKQYDRVEYDDTHEVYRSR
jgi:hypothetical protein